MRTKEVMRALIREVNPAVTNLILEKLVDKYYGLLRSSVRDDLTNNEFVTMRNKGYGKSE